MELIFSWLPFEQGAPCERGVPLRVVDGLEDLRIFVAQEVFAALPFVQAWQMVDLLAEVGMPSGKLLCDQARQGHVLPLPRTVSA